MLAMFCWLQTRLMTRDEKGATAVEYGLMVALIAAIIVAAVSTLGKTVLKSFTDTNTGITGS